MKKVRIGCVITCFVTFIGGFVLSQYIQFLKLDSLEYLTQLERYVAQWTPSLSETDSIILEEHLFGQWRFTERIAALDKEQSDRYNTKFNVSDLGVEELKYNFLMKYNETSVGYTAPLLQGMLSDPNDMFLFGVCGGFQRIYDPIYSIERMDTNIITLSNIYLEGDPTEVELDGAENFIKVSYRSQLYDGVITAQRRVSSDFANTIYIDPNDTDTIYVEFCGLWKLERDDTFYRGGVKYPRG